MKNILFAGSHDAAHRAAIIYSLVSIAKMHGYDTFVYIKELLTELPKAKSSEISVSAQPRGFNYLPM